nr:Epidermin biosynthesis protein like [Ipomoea batatas]
MMFTEGLDESAISWIKQGSDVKKSQSRSPLTDKLGEKYTIPRSPLAYSNSSSHVLPPLKFHSGLLGAHNTVALSTDSNEDEYEDEDDYDGDDNDSESVASAPDELHLHYSDEEIFNLKSKMNSNPGLGLRPTLIRGLSKENLRIELPGNTKRFIDGDSMFLGSATCLASGSLSNCQLRGKVQPHSAYATPIGKLVDELGTPSAPPIIVDIGTEEHHSEVAEASGRMAGIENVTDEINTLNDDGITIQASNGSKQVLSERINSATFQGQDKANIGEMEPKACFQQANAVEHSPHYDTSGQNAWQVLLAYDACIRLCLNSWARGCTEAPEFLRDECKLLRSAFGLHKLLLQPRHVQSTERINKTTEQALPMKVRKAVGKMRVEVRKLRVLPRRKLKSANSLRGAICMQVGADYVRHVSSVVKNRISSLKLHSLVLASEESLSCLVLLRSATEDTQVDPGSAVSLRPGTGDYHDFFPENQGDALLVEVQDSKKNILGQATIPISSTLDNLNDKLRWWPIYLEDHECVGKVQLYINSTFTSDEMTHLKSGPIVETLAYDLLLEAAMRAQQFSARNLGIDEPWKWLLAEFSDYYGVSDSYTKLRYLSHVMDIATPTKDCLELVHELLVPVIKARSEKSLTRQEKTILLDCETRVESLLADVFENYKSLDENSPTGLADISAPIPETAAPALASAVHVYTLLHDILAQDSQTILKNYLQTAAAKRCRKHMVETDEFLSTSSEGFVMDSVTISTAYAKMKNLCINISNEIQADIKIHNQDILPSSIDLSSITTAVYSTELCKRLRAFLAACPPSSPMPHVNELLIATADFERNLELWKISMVQGGVDSRSLYHNYIMVWVEDMQLNLLELCKAEKVPWCGVITNYSTSPFAEEMFEKVKQMLLEYEVVIHRWPQYTLVLENAVANVERAIIKALEKQYSDILTPLKDSVPKRLGMQVQKLARRQSTTLYCIPNQLGTFLNTMKRILDVLHCQVEEILKSWASYLPGNGDRKTTFGEQLNGITVLLRTKYKNYVQAIVVKLASNMQANRSTRLQRILEETKEADGEAEIRERMQMLSTQLSDSICNLQDVFTSRIFIAICRGFWDKMGQIVLKFLEGRKENRVWYNGSYHALGILDDIFASQMQRLQGNALQEKDLEPPRSIVEARSILSRDTTNGPDSSNYLYF